MRLNILSGIGGEFSTNALCLVLHGLLAFSLWVGSPPPQYTLDRKLSGFVFGVCLCMCVRVYERTYYCVFMC